jgi:hypothetical protein
MSSRPGRIVRELAVDLPEERPLTIMGSARFGEYVVELRQALDHSDAATPAMPLLKAA